MHRLLLPLTLFVCGCAAYPTAVAQTPPPTLAPVATLDNGQVVSLQLNQTGSEVYGRAVSQQQFGTAWGALNEGTLCVRISPDSRTLGQGTLVLSGTLNGTGTWSNRTTGANGTLTFAQGTSVAPPSFPLTYQVSANGAQVTCRVTGADPSGGALGTWTSSVPLGSASATSGSLLANFVNGSTLLELDQSAGLLGFTAQPAGVASPLFPSSDLGPTVVTNLTGTATLAP